ncbi:cytochrome P450 [Glaciimonas sp. Gout2]|uniref:cytochrome P450 n=2 Tax=Glaciimonas TaxID=1229970 RepID=UPI002AB444DF|nr:MULTISPECIES: cytochrome P450 [unclassified Glaciimonas]MDY7548683.1 cytochrome P450 [Glaciimonas sp. CA11.2]MEB0014325.1 cytochrome P450 [Glaciimonas sp. Cout2]MEB0083782.1 cytochrome P450 [Glaciimonas sp. Gout2]
MIVQSAPWVSGKIPVLGHLLAFRGNPTPFIQRGLEEHGKLFRFKFLRKTVYVLLGSQNHAAYFHATDAQLGVQEFHRILTPVVGKGIVYDTEPARMDQQMRLLHAAIHEQAALGYIDTIVKVVEEFTSRCGKEGTLNISIIMETLLVKIMSRFILGQDCSSSDSLHISQLYREMKNTISLVSVVWTNAPLLSHWRRDHARRQVENHFLQIIRQRRLQKIKNQDLLGSLMSSRYPDGSALSDDEVIGLAIMTFFAAQTNTPILATWTGLLLAHYPDWSAKIREETEHPLKQYPILPTAIQSQYQMRNFIKEVERLYPTVNLIPRQVLYDFEVGNMVVPAGSFVAVCPPVSHRLAEVFSNPLNFDPDRFSPGREEDKRQAFSLIGFGGGRHFCLGQTMAQQFIKLVWGLLLQKFAFTVDDADLQINLKKPLTEPLRPLMRYRRYR